MAFPWVTKASTSRSVSREVIAGLGGNGHAGRAHRRLRAAGRCDKALPGMLRARGPPGPGIGVPLCGVDQARLRQMEGRLRARIHPDRRIRSRGACAAGEMSLQDLDSIEGRSAPAKVPAVACTRRNSIACIGEALGMAFPVRRPAVGRPPPRHVRAQVRRGSGGPARLGITSRDIMTKGLRKGHRRDHGLRRFHPTPCCTCWPSPAKAEVDLTLAASTASATRSRTSAT